MSMFIWLNIKDFLATCVISSCLIAVCWLVYWAIEPIANFMNKKGEFIILSIGAFIVVWGTGTMVVNLIKYNWREAGRIVAKRQGLQWEKSKGSTKKE